jgi:hypothetical protein
MKELWADVDDLVSDTKEYDFREVENWTKFRESIAKAIRALESMKEWEHHHPRYRGPVGG